MPTGQTDGQTYGRTPDRYIMLSTRHGQRINLKGVYDNDNKVSPGPNGT